MSDSGASASDRVSPGLRAVAGPALHRPVDVDTLREHALAHRGEASELECAALARRFDLPSVESFRYVLETRPWRGGVLVTGRIFARAVQQCVVTLEPLTVEVDESLTRGFLPPDRLYPETKPGAEIEIAHDRELDDVVEALEDPLDLGEIAAESFGLALDPYPRKPGAEPVTHSAIPPGAEPIRDEDVRPFAALAEMRNRLERKDD